MLTLKIQKKQNKMKKKKERINNLHIEKVEGK
jgi:hypothetical protein